MRVWLLIATLASVLGAIPSPFGVDLARATTPVSPNCAQRAALAAFTTTLAARARCQTTRRASTVLGETARPQRHTTPRLRRPPTARTREGGHHYDLQGRLRHQTLGTLNTRSFDYDPEGALLEVFDKLRGRRQYAYDPAEQLLSSVNDKLGEHLYAYDENGNLTAKDTQSLAYDSGNRLRQLGGTHFERDANGQITRQTSALRDDRYEWDAIGQLTAVHHRDGAVTRFGYDAFGRRVFKEHTPAPPKEPVRDPLALSEWAHLPLPGEPVQEADTAPRHILSGRTHYFWAGDDLLAEARDDSLTEYAQWGFVTEALWEDGRIRHVVNSQQGVPQELVDERGQLVWQSSFDDWGRLVSEKGSTTCRLRLPGQLADDETGLHYNRFRYYSPEAGQFISADPIGFGGGSNAYRFAPNAVSWTDPLGLNCRKDGCIADEPQTLWGKSAEEVAGELNAAGFTTNVRGSTRGSQRATIVEVQGHPRISQIQVHPGGGRHVGPYLKVSTNQGTIRVVDSTFKGAEEIKGTIIRIGDQ